MSFHSIVGRMLGQSTIYGNLSGGTSGVAITQPCADASITVGAEAANVRAITIQLKDANGNDIDYVETVMVVVYDSAARTGFATGGTTGIEIGTDGALLALVAKKVFLATSESDGDIDLKWTDTGTESVAVAVYLPNGRCVTTAAFANT